MRGYPISHCSRQAVLKPAAPVWRRLVRYERSGEILQLNTHSGDQSFKVFQAGEFDHQLSGAFWSRLNSDFGGKRLAKTLLDSEQIPVHAGRCFAGGFPGGFAVGLLRPV